MSLAISGVKPLRRSISFGICSRTKRTSDQCSCFLCPDLLSTSCPLCLTTISSYHPHLKTLPKNHFRLPYPIHLIMRTNAPFWELMIVYSCGHTGQARRPCQNPLFRTEGTAMVLGPRDPEESICRNCRDFWTETNPGKGMPEWWWLFRLWRIRGRLSTFKS